MYEKFDWDVAKNRTHPVKFNYLKNNYDKEVSLEQFMVDWKQFRPFDLVWMKQKEYKYISKRLASKYSPSGLKEKYTNLKEKFGFFTGKLE